VPSERTSIAIKVAIVDNTELTIHVGGHTPRVVLLDTCAQPVILIVQFVKKMGMLDSKLQKSMWQIRTPSGGVKEEFGESLDLITLNFNEGTNQKLCLQVRCLITNATSSMCSLGKRPCFHQVSQLTISSNMHTTEWIGRYIPFDLHGNHSRMAHHCMFKEAHTISYIQQTNHKWIEGVEKEIAYAQAIESLRVVPMDIQHELEVLRRFKETHKPLVKALSNFENMESHGKPIKLVFHQLIT